MKPGILAAEARDSNFRARYDEAQSNVRKWAEKEIKATTKNERQFAAVRKVAWQMTAAELKTKIQ